MELTKITASTITERLRRQQALELRLRGLKYRQIGEAMGIGEQGARKVCQRAIRDVQGRLEETVQEARSLDLLRLDEMIFALTERLKDPQAKDFLGCINTLNGLMKRRAEMYGYDAAKKLEHSGEVGIREYVGINPDDVS
jgi:hypothetical protein